jgi:multicomponent Na+:H+ antiporter subunit D
MSDVLSYLPPAVIMILAGIIIPFLSDRARQVVVLVAPLLTLAQIWTVPAVAETAFTIDVASFTLRPILAHEFTYIFATIFAIASFAGGIFGLFQARAIETAAAFIYAGSAIGVTFSGDFISMFIFWELMAIGSTMVIFASTRKRAVGAGLRYACVHFFGGALLLAGIAAHLSLLGNASLIPFNVDTGLLFHFDNMDIYTVAVWLVLAGILVNAAAPPISAWLPDAYPEASPAGSVFLSAFTTKTAVFVLLTLFPGTELLIYVGLFMVFYGIVMAILENDMRRILSYSIINQVGFMITGIGIGTELALQGVALHAFCHIIYKALLFMSAGSVLFMTGKTRCSDLGGLYHSMKLTAVCGIIGALAISAFPLTSGFVSKSLISSAAAYEELAVVWFLLAAASAGVFLHAGIKFPWFVFFQKDSGMRPNDPPWNMRIAMILMSILCIAPAIPGVTEMTLYRLLPTVPEYEAYTTAHVVTQLQLLLFSGLAFFVMLPLLKRTKTISLDFDWFYRGFGYYVVLIFGTLTNFPRRVGRIYAKKTLRRGLNMMWHAHSPGGVLARNWPLGVTLTWVLGLLGVYLFTH